MAPFEIRFQVIPFGPFIPRIDEHEPIFKGAVGNDADHCGQALGKPIRRPVDDHNRVLTAARRVVPAHKDAGIVWKIGLLPEHEASCFLVVVDLQAVAEDAQTKVSQELTQSRAVARRRIRLEGTG